MTSNLNSDITELPEYLHEALMGHFSQRSARVEVEQELVLPRLFSTVRFINVTFGGRTTRVISKTIIPNEVNRAFLEQDNQAEVEFNILKSLHPKFSEIPKCSVPKPLLLIADQTTYLMEYVAGEDLDSWLTATRGYLPSARWERAKEYFSNTGLWLRNFQDFTGFTFEDETALDPLNKRMIDRLKDLHQKCEDKELAKKLEAKMHNIFLTGMGMLSDSGDKVPVCGRHGDFGGWNIIANDDGVTVIDFMGFGRDPAVMDFVKMLVCFHDNEHCLGYRKSRLDELKDLFVAGYSSHHVTPEPVWLLCEAYYRLCSIIGCQQAANFRWDNRRMKKSILKKHLAWFDNPEETSAGSLKPVGTHTNAGALL